MTGMRVLAAAQVAHEVRMAHEVVDAQAEVGAPRQVEQLAGLAIEPDDLALRIEHDDAIGHRGGGTAQLAEQPREPFLVESLATVQAHHLRHDIAPQTHRVRRIGDAAMLRARNAARAAARDSSARYSASAPLMPSQTEPASQPSSAPAASAARIRSAT